MCERRTVQNGPSEEGEGSWSGPTHSRPHTLALPLSLILANYPVNCVASVGGIGLVYVRSWVRVVPPLCEGAGSALSEVLPHSTGYTWKSRFPLRVRLRVVGGCKYGAAVLGGMWPNSGAAVCWRC